MIFPTIFLLFILSFSNSIWSRALCACAMCSDLQMCTARSWPRRCQMQCPIHGHAIIAAPSQSDLYLHTCDRARNEIKTCLAITIGNKQSLIRSHLYRPFNINEVSARGRRTNLHNFNPLTLAVPGIQSNSTSTPLPPSTSHSPPPARVSPTQPVPSNYQSFNDVINRVYNLIWKSPGLQRAA